jgi:hypothetical protein
MRRGAVLVNTASVGSACSAAGERSFSDGNEDIEVELYW